MRGDAGRCGEMWGDVGRSRGICRTISSAIRLSMWMLFQPYLLRGRGEVNSRPRPRPRPKPNPNPSPKPNPHKTLMWMIFQPYRCGSPV